MTSALLSAVAKIHGGGRLGLSGKNFVLDGVPAYGAAGVNGYLETAEYENQDAVILSSIGARCGKCFFARGSWTSLANTQVILPDPDKVDAGFLWYQLNDESRWPRSGSAQPFIKPSDVKGHEVFIPSLDEQRRIAAILDAADAIRTKRRALLSEIDHFSRVVLDRKLRDGVGDLVELRDVALVLGGKRLPKGAPYADGPTAHPYIRVSDLRGGRIRTEDLRYLTPEVHRSISRYTVAEGDVVLSIAGSTGVSAPVGPELNGANLTENAAKIVPRGGKSWLAPWLSRLLQSPDLQSQIRGRVGQVTIEKLALFRIEQLRFRLSPLADQREFVDQADAIETERSLVERALATDDDLFASLRARAFSGGL
jgi:hypothetical protein